MSSLLLTPLEIFDRYGFMDKGLVIITGASSGIGAALAQLFHEKGYPLLLLARRESKIKSDRVLCKKVDVSDLSSFKKAVLEAEAKFGPTACLINNAAVLYLALFHEQNPEEWKQTFNVNITGAANGMHLVLPGMVKRRKGTIINISSISGHAPYPLQAAYSASKFALRALTECIRQEVSGYNIRLMLVSPGAVETEVGKETTCPKIKAEFDSMRKAVGPLDPHCIAEAVLFAYEQPDHVCFRDMVITPTPTVSEE
jgi:NADP-dependent 3-hydroxy acid dehydrogenase YdfG